MEALEGRTPDKKKSKLYNTKVNVKSQVLEEASQCIYFQMVSPGWTYVQVLTKQF